MSENEKRGLQRLDLDKRFTYLSVYLRRCFWGGFLVALAVFGCGAAGIIMCCPLVFLLLVVAYLTGCPEWLFPSDGAMYVAWGACSFFFLERSVFGFLLHALREMDKKLPLASEGRPDL